MSFFGFSGNGTVHTADATQVSNLLGSTTITAQLGSGALVPISVPLSVEFVQGLGSGFLGLTATVPVDSGDTVGIASLENSVPGFVSTTHCSSARHCGWRPQGMQQVEKSGGSVSSSLMKTSRAFQLRLVHRCAWPVCKSTNARLREGACRSRDAWECPSSRARRDRLRQFERAQRP